MTHIGSGNFKRENKKQDGLKTKKTYSINQNTQQAMQRTAAKNGRKVYGLQFAG